MDLDLHHPQHRHVLQGTSISKGRQARETTPSAAQKRLWADSRCCSEPIAAIGPLACCDARRRPRRTGYVPPQRIARANHLSARAREEHQQIARARESRASTAGHQEDSCFHPFPLSGPGEERDARWGSLCACQCPHQAARLDAMLSCVRGELPLTGGQTNPRRPENGRGAIRNGQS